MNNNRENNILAPLLVFIIGVAVAAFYSFVMFDKISGSHHVLLDPDKYGALGINLLEKHEFTFSPDYGPTVYRGPLYPLFIALILFISKGWYPYSVWIAQSVLHGAVCFLVYLIAKQYWNKAVGQVAGFGCAIYPIFLWYVPRILTEVFLEFLTICLVYFSLRLMRKESFLNSICVGLFLGLLCLTKATFIPFIIIIPASFLILRMRSRIIYLLPIVFIAVLIISPWTYRNYMLSKKIVPVHTGTGFNLKMGNEFAKDIFSAPFSYAEIWDKDIDKVRQLVKDVLVPAPIRDIEEDRIYMASALSDLKHDPGLVLKKVFVSGFMFWYIGETFYKTIFIMLLSMPILVLSIFGIYRVMRRGNKELWLLIIVVLFYWLLHIPFAPPFRLSVPIFPILFIFAASNISRFKSNITNIKEGVIGNER